MRYSSVRASTSRLTSRSPTRQDARGDDPALDALILRLHIETACGRGGALALRPIDLDPDQCA
jgi:hypothetical protein